MEYNLADIFELAADQFTDREYMVANGKRCTFKEMEQRANRLAHHLASQGIGKDDHVGIYAYNCIEWVEALWAVFKLRAVWININYRYVEDELTYIFDNADLKALIYQREFSERINNIQAALPKVEHFIVIEDGSEVVNGTLTPTAYETAMAENSPERDFPPVPGMTSTCYTPVVPPACPRGSSGATRMSSLHSVAASTKPPESLSAIRRRCLTVARTLVCAICPFPH